VKKALDMFALFFFAKTAQPSEWPRAEKRIGGLLCVTGRPSKARNRRLWRSPDNAKKKLAAF
jgi:hypothetical protein